MIEKRDQILHRWDRLKAALIEKRSKLGESQTLQQFSRDADEIENWIAEKFQIAQEESYRDPSHIQQKHQKQQAFEAELAANADRIATLITAGQNLIDSSKCSGGEVNNNKLNSFLESSDLSRKPSVFVKNFEIKI